MAKFLKRLGRSASKRKLHQPKWKNWFGFAVIAAIAVVMLLLSGCKSKETSTSVEYRDAFRQIEVRDSLIKGVKLQASFPCITDVPANIPVKVPEKTGQGSVVITPRSDGTIDIECEGKDQLITKLKEQISSLETQKSSSRSEVVRYKIPTWIWWVLPLVTLLVRYLVISKLRTLWPIRT